MLSLVDIFVLNFLAQYTVFGYELLSAFKEASQISSYNSESEASKAVDGYTNGTFHDGHCTHTVSAGDVHWWYVNLGTESAVVLRILIHNREDLCPESLAGAIISVGHHSVSPFIGNHQCGSSVSKNMTLLANPIEFVCEPAIRGQYVTVYKTGNGALTLCEVQVYGFIGSLSVLQETHQSSTYSSWSASKAVDGYTDEDISKGHCSHTRTDNNAWWYVDIGKTAFISMIVIYNRGDCCADRIAGAVVSVGHNNISPFDGNLQCGSSVSSYAASNINPIELVCEPVANGHYVTIYLNNGVISLCEVEVYRYIGCPGPYCLAVLESTGNSKSKCLTHDILRDMTLAKSLTANSKIKCFRFCITTPKCEAFQLKREEGVNVCYALKTYALDAQYDVDLEYCYLFRLELNHNKML